MTAARTVAGESNLRALACDLESAIRDYGRRRAMVALSGGVDSAVVTALAARALEASDVVAVTAVSPSYPEDELASAREAARAVGVEHVVISTGEVGREAYARNDQLRCFHCKTELFAALERIASMDGGGTTAMLAGANADDALDFRPGLLAARAAGVHNPLLELGVGKEAVRGLARLVGLATMADKPAMACLSSRVAFGVRITPGLLARIDRAERAVRALGFATVRVRHFGAWASIEVDPGRVQDLRAHPGLPSLMDQLRSIGWARVELSAEGYRQGSMNATLPEGQRVAFSLDQVRSRRPPARIP